MRRRTKEKKAPLVTKGTTSSRMIWMALGRQWSSWPHSPFARFQNGWKRVLYSVMLPTRSSSTLKRSSGP